MTSFRQLFINGEPYREQKGISMLTSHAILLKYRHDPRFSFTDIGIWYIDRGAGGDRSWVFGPDIGALESHYFEVVSGSGIKCIPYHRIRKITYLGRTVWEKMTNPGSGTGTK